MSLHADGKRRPLCPRPQPARVDVLAVIGRAIRLAMFDRAQRGSPRGPHNDAAAYTEARAAVAESIADIEAFASDYSHGLGPDVSRLRAALARIAP